MSGVVSETVGLGTLILSIPFSVGAYYQIKAYYRQDAAREKAEDAAEKAAATQLVVQQVLAQLQPTNGKTVAQVAENSNDAVHRVETTLNAHISNSAIHVKAVPRRSKQTR